MIPSAELVPGVAGLGALLAPSGGIFFRAWAPGHRSVEALIERPGRPLVVPLRPSPGGYFSGWAREAAAGDLYRYRIDGAGSYPDPVSRFQPMGPHGPSQVIDPSFPWTDGGWPGLSMPGQVFYELHIGTYTPEGTWRTAALTLEALAALGVTVVCVMPVAEFPGRFGWGYDGVDLFAPYHGYGRPEDFRSFVDRAHGVGLGVVLDVVYNHLGPDGNYLRAFSPHYLSRKSTDWGEAVNYDGPGSEGVRRFFCENAAYWVSEFHVDGLRLDATQSICDRSGRHILGEVAAWARRASRGRGIVIVAENEPQDLELLRPRGEGGCGLDAIWNDDFHHSAATALTGKREAYYVDYAGSPQELVSACKWGTLYQGQHYVWQDGRRGRPSWGFPACRFVNYLENHDQVSNGHAAGARLAQTASPGRYRALSALLLLGPQTPLLFQGQERGSRSPFCFFADHGHPLRRAVREGRRKFMGQFASLRSPGMQAEVPDPADEATFRRCVLQGGDPELAALYRDLLRLRRADEVFLRQDSERLFGAVLGPAAFALRFFGDAGDDRLVLVNLGAQLLLVPTPEPLLAPPRGAAWALLWSSEDPRYGGGGTPQLDEDRWEAPAESALVYRPLRPGACRVS